MKKRVLAGVIALSCLGGGEALATAYPPNPMLFCIYSSANIKPQAQVAVRAAASLIDKTNTNLTGWATSYAWPSLPPAGQRVCVTVPSWTDSNFAYTDTIGYPSSPLMLNNVPCTNQGLVSSRSQIGYGIQYALHFSVTGVDSSGKVTSCKVGQVDYN